MFTTLHKYFCNVSDNAFILALFAGFIYVLIYDIKALDWTLGNFKTKHSLLHLPLDLDLASLRINS